MASMAEDIRDYVKKHNNKVSNREVIDYIIKVKKINTTRAGIRVTLWNVLNELGGTLILDGIREDIRDYVIKKNKSVTFKEVKKYICEDLKMDVTENYIRKILREVLAEVGGTLKRSSLKENIKDYVKKHDNEVTFEEVKDYTREKGIDRMDASLRGTLRDVLQEVGGTLKPPKK